MARVIVCGSGALLLPLPLPPPEHPARRRPAAAGIATSASRERREDRNWFMECLSCDFIVVPACTGRDVPPGVLGARTLSHAADRYPESLFVIGDEKCSGRRGSAIRWEATGGVRAHGDEV